MRLLGWFSKDDVKMAWHIHKWAHHAIFTSSLTSVSSLLKLPYYIFQDDNATRDLNEQLDALKAHLDYVQDNITEAQTEIVDLEVCKNIVEVLCCTPVLII